MSYMFYIVVHLKSKLRLTKLTIFMQQMQHNAPNIVNAFKLLRKTSKNPPLENASEGYTESWKSDGNS